MVTNQEKQLLTLLAACVKDDSTLGTIMLHRISTGEDYHFVKNLGDYSFLTGQGVSVCKRVQQFILPESASYSTACSLDSELNSIVTEFKQLLEESEKNAGTPINSQYQPVHIMEKSKLSDLIGDKKKALEDSGGYRVWKERNNYVYRNEEAGSLKKEMDSFAIADSSLEEIYASYATLNTFKNRVEGNKKNIIAAEVYKQQRKKQITDNLYKRIDNLSYKLIFISGLVVIVSGYFKDKLWGGFYTFGAEILAFCVLMAAINIIKGILVFIGGFFTKNYAQTAKLKTILSMILMISLIISWFVFLNWFAARYRFSWTWTIYLYNFLKAWAISLFK